MHQNSAERPSKQVARKLPRHTNIAKFPGNELRPSSDRSEAQTSTINRDNNLGDHAYETSKFRLHASGQSAVQNAGEKVGNIDSRDLQHSSEQNEDILLQNLSLLLNPKIIELKTAQPSSSVNRELETIASRSEADDTELYNVRNKLNAAAIHNLLKRAAQIESDAAVPSQAQKIAQLEELAESFNVDKKLVLSLTSNFNSV
ncbi:hypothetical protein AYI69_g10486 [Smittium culicis]|uniref:Uncharacterized protein n=1 Tax=Smittium culicis TaxID=133412 RepID=A0A1R1X5C1_9FUNG|nr:hypothetical protein AYI69_g10486 [Smittium culicis]